MPLSISLLWFPLRVSAFFTAAQVVTMAGSNQGLIDAVGRISQFNTPRGVSISADG
jgi:hypothetical protein